MAPLIPNLSGIDPRTLAASTWSRTEASKWAAPNVAGMLNASAPAVSLGGSPLLPAPRRSSEAPSAVLPVPEDLAARASGAWHASLGHHGLPAVTQRLGPTVVGPSLALGSGPFAVAGPERPRSAQLHWVSVGTPSLGAVSEWARGASREQNQTRANPRVSENLSWLSLELTMDPRAHRGSEVKSDAARTEAAPSSRPLAPSPSPLLQALQQMAPDGGRGGRQLAGTGQAAQLVDEQAAWYEQFKANISNIAASAETVPASTWAHVQGAAMKPPSPVLPSPMRPLAPNVFATQSRVPAEARAQEEAEGERRGRKEADLLSQMETREGAPAEDARIAPAVAQAAGLIFGGSYNAVVEAARSKALREIKGLSLPPLLASTEPPRAAPLLQLSASPPSLAATMGIPPRALSAFLSATQPMGPAQAMHSHEMRMDPLKPLDFSLSGLGGFRDAHSGTPGQAAPPHGVLGGSPPASISLRGWGTRSGASSVASLDMLSPGGAPHSRKRSLEGSSSGEERRLRRQSSYDLAVKRQRGKRGQSQEPSTKLTLELGSGEPSSEERGAAQSQPAARRASPQLLPPGGFGGVFLPDPHSQG